MARPQRGVPADRATDDLAGGGDHRVPPAGRGEGVNGRRHGSQTSSPRSPSAAAPVPAAVLVADGRALAPWTGAAAVVGAGATGFFAVFDVGELLGFGEVVVLLGDGFCVDVALLELVVLLELVGLLDVVVLELLDDVDGSDVVELSDVVDEVVVGVGTWLSPTPVREGKSTVLVPFRAPSMNAVQIFTGKVPPVSSPKPAMFCIGLGLPLTSL